MAAGVRERVCKVGNAWPVQRSQTFTEDGLQRGHHPPCHPGPTSLGPDCPGDFLPGRGGQLGLRGIPAHSTAASAHLRPPPTCRGPSLLRPFEVFLGKMLGSQSPFGPPPHHTPLMTFGSGFLEALIPYPNPDAGLWKTL